MSRRKQRLREVKPLAQDTQPADGTMRILIQETLCPCPSSYHSLSETGEQQRLPQAETPLFALLTSHLSVFLCQCPPLLVFLTLVQVRILLPGQSHGWRSLVGCSPWGCSGLDTTERLHFHFSLSCIGEGNGNPLQCSCLENPGRGEPGGLPSTGVAQSQTGLKH